MTKPMPEAGEHTTGTHTFSAGDVAAFARLIGDTNPLHHDTAAAAASRFGGLIASGGHTASVMMGQVAAWMSRDWDNVGLGYAVKLRRPVPVGSTCAILWCVASVEHSARLGGTIVNLEGRLVREDGETAVTATSQALIFDAG